jgi:hypothetical protein
LSLGVDVDGSFEGEVGLLMGKESNRELRAVDRAQWFRDWYIVWVVRFGCKSVVGSVVEFMIFLYFLIVGVAVDNYFGIFGVLAFGCGELYASGWRRRPLHLRVARVSGEVARAHNGRGCFYP